MRGSRAPVYAAIVASGVTTILGGALIAEAWSGEAPKKTAIPLGLGLLVLGAVLGFEGSKA